MLIRERYVFSYNTHANILYNRYQNFTERNLGMQVVATGNPEVIKLVALFRDIYVCHAPFPCMTAPSRSLQMMSLIDCPIASMFCLYLAVSHDAGAGRMLRGTGDSSPTPFTVVLIGTMVGCRSQVRHVNDIKHVSIGNDQSSFREVGGRQSASFSAATSAIPAIATVHVLHVC